jgi:hypothetical protein
MSLHALFEAYIAAFNAGDSPSYARFYAPEVRFRNGAGVELRGATAVAAHYDTLKGSMERRIEVKAVICGETSIAALLSSRFHITADGVPFAGELLDRGDTVNLRSAALYELENGKFARIEATTLDRQIVRARRLPG